jgi:hypothetical protein
MMVRTVAAVLRAGQIGLDQAGPMARQECPDRLGVESVCSPNLTAGCTRVGSRWGGNPVLASAMMRLKHLRTQAVWRGRWSL